MTAAITTPDVGRDVRKVAAAGLLTGVLTPLLQPVVDLVPGFPGDVRIGLLALPFAILVFSLVRRNGAGRPSGAIASALVTVIAFICAVNAAVWIDGQLPAMAKALRNVLSGLAGGFVGTALMALGIGFGLLRPGQREPRAWLPMLVAGTLAGALLALDLGLGLQLASFLFPVWQAGVAVTLVMALQASRR